MEKENNVDEQVYELIVSKLDAVHSDLRQMQVTLNGHIEKDEQHYKEVFFIKRAFQVTWTVLMGVAGFLGWTGMRGQ